MIRQGVLVDPGGGCFWFDYGVEGRESDCGVAECPAQFW